MPAQLSQDGDAEQKKWSSLSGCCATYSWSWQPDESLRSRMKKVEWKKLLWISPARYQTIMVWRHGWWLLHIYYICCLRAHAHPTVVTKEFKVNGPHVALEPQFAPLFPDALAVLFIVPGDRIKQKRWRKASFHLNPGSAWKYGECLARKNIMNRKIDKSFVCGK